VATVTQAVSIFIAYLDPGSGDTGAQIAAFVIAFLVVLAVLVLVVVLVRRANSRPCPRWGRRVRTGKMQCESCGFDFETVGRQAPI
jgi:threonine/homoserine/homoserine lactone efflux protein